MFERVIVYAMGQVFQQYKDSVDWKCVVAIADEKESNVREWNNVPVIHPNQLYEYEFDYVAIFSNKHFESIKRTLVGTYFIPSEKIVSWKEVICQEKSIGYDVSMLMREYLRENNYKKILDVGMNIIPHSILSVDALFPHSIGVIDGVKGKDAMTNACVYRKVYANVKKANKHYDAVLITDKDFWNQIDVLKEKTDVVISHFFILEEGQKIFDTYFDSTEWKLQQMSTVEGVLWIAKKNGVLPEKDTAIYVVTHKEYGVKSDKLYRPLCVGGFSHEGYETECIGENISYLNAKINECTALYWIWKNTSCEYVGLNHYRRYFYNSSMKNTGNYLNQETIHKLLEDYDIILPETHPMPVSVREIDRLRATMNVNAFDQGYELVRKVIEKNQPDYLQAFHDVMNGHTIFVCNMFVTKRDVLNAYCEWLFSFLIEVAEMVEVESYDDYSKRVIGFFAERMWTVWLRKQTLKIKEMPYDEI